MRISHVQQPVLPQLQEHHWGSASPQAGRNPKVVTVLAQIGPHATLLTPRLLPTKQYLSVTVFLDLQLIHRLFWHDMKCNISIDWTVSSTCSLNPETLLKVHFKAVSELT